MAERLRRSLGLRYGGIDRRKKVGIKGGTMKRPHKSRPGNTGKITPTPLPESSPPRVRSGRLLSDQRRPVSRPLIAARWERAELTGAGGALNYLPLPALPRRAVWPSRANEPAIVAITYAAR